MLRIITDYLSLKHLRLRENDECLSLITNRKPNSNKKHESNYVDGSILKLKDTSKENTFIATASK